MLTRLKVSGFKNLIDVDIRFGPFTCIAGANGIGKSNLFDAIQFLSALANHPLIDAALSVRAEKGNTGDLRNIFHRLGNQYSENMSFEAEMIIPKEGIDDLGQKATASMTFLRYSLALCYHTDDNLSSLGKLKLIEEKLEHINRSEAPKFLKFPHSAGKWRKSVLHGRRSAPYISTEKNKEGNPIIKLAQDGSGGMPKSFLVNSLPRTVLSTVNATEIRTSLEYFPCDILFIHRDAEKEPRENRAKEIWPAYCVSGMMDTIQNPPICVIPVRMQEAWLLFDETAIRRAAGNKNGQTSLPLPSLITIESVPDPKNLLYECLKIASGRTGRRLKKFRPASSAHQIPNFIEDFTPLRSLSAFIAFENDLRGTLKKYTDEK